jgi:hypothetical protein
VNSQLAESFLACYARLPAAVREQARRAYRLWRANPSHPGVQFKRVHATEPIFSARVGIGWTALGLLEGNTVTWFWIGSHMLSMTPCSHGCRASLGAFVQAIDWRLNEPGLDTSFGGPFSRDDSLPQAIRPFPG